MPDKEDEKPVEKVTIHIQPKNSVIGIGDNLTPAKGATNDQVCK